MAALAEAMADHRVVLRQIMAPKAVKASGRLARFAADHGIGTADLEAAAAALAKLAEDPQSTWNIRGFAEAAEALKREIGRTLRAEELWKAIEDEGGDPQEEREAVKNGRLVEALVSLVAKDFYSARDEEAAARAAEPAMPLPERGVHPTSAGYVLIPPARILVGEAQLWKVEALAGAAPAAGGIVWTVDGVEVGQGRQCQIKLDSPDTVTVSARVDLGGGVFTTPSATVRPGGRTGIADAARIERRARRQIFWRTVFNGILITIIGYALLESEQTGYAGLFFAFVWGLSADISADRLNTIVSKSKLTV
jgi:hypothetical protein